MQDLIKEEEFLKKPYNPWKLFYTFYAIAFIQLLLFIVALLVMGQNAGLKTGIAAFLLPTITVFVMFFFNKKNALLPYKTIATGTALLFAVYYIPSLIMSIFGGNAIKNALAFLLLVALNWAICFFVMYLVAKSRKKKVVSKDANLQ